MNKNGYKVSQKKAILNIGPLDRLDDGQPNYVGRLLKPASKCATVRQNNGYYTSILKDFNLDNMYDALSFIAQNKEKIIRRMNTSLVKKAGLSPEIIYYDVTNFYFEIEEPDDDILDEDGTVLAKGQRKFGVCKEERHLPIVQMGLFMDDNGIPIAVEPFPGVMKGDLQTRPVYARTPEHVDARLLICMVALVLIRIIQKRVRDLGEPSGEGAYWNIGMSGERIQTALNKWKADVFPDDFYRFLDVDDPDLALILKAFGIEIPAKPYRRSELKSIKTGTEIFM